MITAVLDEALAHTGMTTRGAFHAEPGESLLSNMATLVLIGNIGPMIRYNFSKNVSNRSHPLDSWTKQVLGPIAADFGAKAVFPFDGPPYYPFQRWAMRADDVTQSPIGPLVHPVFGMWHAYRAAFLFKDRLELPVKAETASPCASCVEKPCLNTCPVSAFSAGQYDVSTCRAHIALTAGEDCLNRGCLARRACPVGREYIYEPAQARFHMQQFLDAE